MTLLLNYRPVLHQPTGIGVYANSILPELQKLPNHLIIGGHVGSSTHRLTRAFWTQYRLPQIAHERGASLIFTPAPEGYLGLQKIPQVVMVHDLRPISHPERSLQSIYFRSWVPHLLDSCMHVLTNSQFTATEIQRCTKIDGSKISVIPLGFNDEVFNHQTVSKRQLDYPYLLHVGQAYPHKNLARVINAFSKCSLAFPELRLVLAGKSHPTESKRLVNLVNHLGLREKVNFLSYVEAKQLPGLYRHAMALVYPSLWEGFGLPVLEAMASGTPVITSLGSATGELASDAAILVDPCSTDQITSAMLDLISQPTLRSDLVRRGLQRASQYSWRMTSIATANILRSLMSSL